MTASSLPLLCCPFCGNTARLEARSGVGSVVVCTSEGCIDGGIGHSGAEATALWNRRVSSDGAEAEAVRRTWIDLLHLPETTDWIGLLLAVENRGMQRAIERLNERRNLLTLWSQWQEGEWHQERVAHALQELEEAIATLKKSCTYVKPS